MEEGEASEAPKSEGEEEIADTVRKKDVSAHGPQAAFSSDTVNSNSIRSNFPCGIAEWDYEYLIFWICVFFLCSM
ncbi:hypothetical protein FKM82_024682 [Ascaphus truei]